MAAIGTGVLTPISTTPAFAVDARQSGAQEAFGTESGSSGSSGQPEQDTEEARAQREAAKSGKQVEILGKRDETTQVLANPDGSFTWRQYIRPAFARTGGQWRKADATLRQDPTGRISPVAATFGLSFSGGGTDPLAVMDKGGRTLSISWPDPLPAPRLGGDTAVYPEVLPGVDLRIRADVDGFAQHLVVKTREAAQHPRLAELSLGLKTQGTTLKEDGAGNLAATDAKGVKLFGAPAPAMWDSAHLAAPEAEKLRKGSTVEVAETVPPAKLVEMDTAVDGDRLRITPDAAVLDDPKTVYPVVIDPIFSGGQRNNWAMAYKQAGNANIANTPFWNGGTFSDKLARVGHENATDGTARSFFQMNTKGLDGATILKATFQVFNSYSWSCTATPVELGHTGPITTATSWNKPPVWHKTLQTKTFAHGWSPTQCGPEGEDFADPKLKAVVQSIADSGADTLTLGLRSADSHEGAVSSWKKFQNDPYLEVDFNSPPKVDSSAAYQGSWSPSATGNQHVLCNTSTDAASWPLVGNAGVTLTAKVSDPQGGQVTGAFSIGEYAGANLSQPANAVTSGGTSQVRVQSSALTDGKAYQWIVQARDGIDTSAWTAPCRFKVDKTAPTKPTVTAADGFALDVAEVPARKTRSITFESSDTVGLDGFCYNLNDPLSVSSTKCANGTFVAADANGRATVSVTPSLWPNNRLHVQAYDKAGNTSLYSGADGSETDTTLIVTARPEFVRDADGRAAGDLPGDLDGDGHIDLVATDSAGDLRLYAGDGNGTGDIRSSSVLDRGGWNGVVITHRGDFTAATVGQTKDGYEDYFVKIGNKLYLYPGDGTGNLLTAKRVELLHPTGKQTGRLTGSGGKCLDVRSGATANGTPIQIYGCNDTAAQDFHLTGGALKVLGKCVAADGVDNRAAAELWTCDGDSRQQWRDRGDGSLVNAASGLCLDLPGGSATDGNALQIYDCNRSAAQRWVVPGSWSGTGEILAVGDADGMPGNDLMVREGVGMWLYSGTVAGPLDAEPGSYKLRPGKQFGYSGWDAYDWIAPGDITGDGVTDLLGRLHSVPSTHADYGKLFLYPGARTTDTTGTSLYRTGTRSVYGTASWQPANIPSLASAGNAQGTVVDHGTYKQFVPTAGEESPDFWATQPGGASGTGVLRFYPGRPAAHGSPTVVGEAGWTSSIAAIF
ncbi:ricin-type beta-trefoil lectin domain protein [Streptomyces sp. NPDC056222]|uniref:ricin-type beta-trefoil lectin domain protein n=1 Tax=Streptomyces sp. NPDC056222 TaxID=3345749 RepID=UPI0035D6D208